MGIYGLGLAAWSSRSWRFGLRAPEVAPRRNRTYEHGDTL